MKTLALLVFALFGGLFFTGCEHEHWEHHHGYGRPAPYEYGGGGYYHRGPERDWDWR